MTASLGMGFSVGHWTDDAGRTGCTVILPPPGNVTSCDIRGSSPSSREIELLHPDRKLTEVHALLLTGGSAFGLAAADGVVEWLAERGIGYQTAVTPVPIVPAAVIFDLRSGDPAARPGPDGGRAACDAAAVDAETGRIGAGAGATVGKWAGFEHRAEGGVGIGRAESAGLAVAALAVVNAVGDVLDEDGAVLAGTTAPDPTYTAPARRSAEMPMNTVLAVVAMEATLDKRDVRFLASRGSDGITIAVRPAHTRYDGDVVFAVAAPKGDPATPYELDVLGHLATSAVAQAVRDAVRRPPARPSRTAAELSGN
ncbi:MAG: P1 family peptidase [Actinomycetota bacterium]|nr:P1 family peptidase [Actinomycetota bacterium]